MIKLELTSTEAMNLAIALRMSKNDLDTEHYLRGWESVNTRLNELACKMDQEGNYELASKIRSAYNHIDNELDEEY